MDQRIRHGQENRMHRNRDSHDVYRLIVDKRTFGWAEVIIDRKYRIPGG
jgi:hypothetical protein